MIEVKKSIKKLIKKLEKINPDLKVRFKKNHFDSIKIYNKGGLISVLEPFELQQLIEAKRN